MNGFELNKFAAAILLAGIIALAVGMVTDGLYQPERKPEKRGYEIAGAEEASTAKGATSAEPAKPVDIAAFMGAGDAAAGEILTKKCTACHDFTKGGPNKVGPNLWNVLGRDVAKHGGYAYSKVLQDLGGHWDYQRLSEFLTAPGKYAKGSKMAFAGLGKPEDRANIIAYLRSLSDNPLPLPAAPAPTPTPAPEAAAETVVETPVPAKP